MKTVRIIIAAFAVVLATGLTANAQKMGYVDGEGLVSLLPEIKDVQTKLQQYQQDSIGGEYDRLMAEYNRTDSIIKNSKTKSLVDAATKDQQTIAATLSQWQQTATQLNNMKSAQLLQPLYEKVRKAIQDVAKEKGVAYVLAPDVLIVSPPGDDLTPAVATKLGIKLPTPATGARP